MASTGGIVFALTARDLASKTIGKVNTSLGKLGSAGKIAAGGIALATAATAALGKLAIDAVQAAAADERSTILLNAALKQRGFNVKALTIPINEQIDAMARLGIEDDQVRAGLEIGSRFFKDQETLLKANAIAAQISAATGKDMSDVMMILGKAANGQGKGLKELGLKTETLTKKTVYKTKKDELGHLVTVKTTKLVKKQTSIQDILTEATEKYGGIAEELANSTSGKFASAQIGFNEAMEKLGYKLLPEVNKVLDWLTTTGLPAFEQFIANIAPVYQAFIDEAITPLTDALGRVGKMLGTDMGVWADAAMIALLPLKIVIQTLTAGLNLLADAGQFFGLGREGTGVSANPMNDKYGGVSNPMSSKYGGGSPTVVTNVNIGTKKVDTVVSDSLLRMGFGFPPPRQ